MAYCYSLLKVTCDPTGLLPKFGRYFPWAGGNGLRKLIGGTV
jgi:hypothetical protein